MSARLSKLKTSTVKTLRVTRRGLKLIPRLARDPSKLRRILRDSPLRRRLDFRAGEWERQVNAAYAAREWENVVTLAQTVLRKTYARHTPDIRLQLIHSHAQLGQFKAVDRQLKHALRRHPNSAVLLRARAERAMSLNDFGVALSTWQRSSEAEAEPTVVDGEVDGFPAWGTVFDWYEFAWIQCAERWTTSWEQVKARPSAIMYRRVIQTLSAADELEAAEKISVLALRQFPEDTDLTMQATAVLARNSHDAGTTNIVDILRRSNCTSIASAITHDMEQAQSILKDIEALGPTGADEFRILTTYRRSGAEFMVRTSNFWDERRIHDEAMRLAKRDKWPEQTADTDLVSAKAWAEAQRFAATRAEEVGVAAPALARSLFQSFKQEVTQKIPVDRIADEIARTCPDEPIFINLGPLRFKYMVGYPHSRMQTLYFYDALRRRGCNVTLSAFPRRPHYFTNPDQVPEPVRMPVVTLFPQPAQLRPPVRPLEQMHGHPTSMVVPAGIRSVKRLLDRVDDTIVVNSGSAVKEFAYDRSIEQDWGYDVHMSLHSPERHLLPIFHIETSAARAWRRETGRIVGSSTAPSKDEPIEAFLSAGTWVVDDWHSWLDRALVPYLRDLVERIDEKLQQHKIMDVHIGDYLYAEPSLIAAKVRERGGRVHIWPHSTNPVHVAFHDTHNIETVHAVTKSGSEIWQAAAPEAHVVRDAGLMLDPPHASVPFIAGEPLSIVVIGGRPVMRNLPILDIAAHEDLYRRFFTALEPLVDEGRVRVFFKPRGKSGEHEMWLERLVGRTAGWKRVLEHPMRTTLPNPVFVSLSVGSSALLEGVTRGIPGLIIREGFARDYLATEDGLFEIFDVARAVALISGMHTDAVWDAHRNEQIRRLAKEIEVSP